MKKGVITDYSWRRKRIILYIIGIFLIFTIPAFIVFFYSIRHVNYLGVSPSDHPLQDVFDAQSFRLEDVTQTYTLTTEDGLDLWCAEVKAENLKGVMIYLTDMKEPSVTYFFGHAAWMRKKGFASFLLETRAHGRSKGFRQGFGISEVKDVKAVIDLIKQNNAYYGKPIIIQGLGIGGTTAINACGVLPEVTACIAMAPVASVETQVDLIMKQFYVPQFIRDFEKSIVHQGLRLSYGINEADQNTPMKQIMVASQKPMLIITDSLDKVIPVENTYELQRMNSGAEFWYRMTDNHCIVKNNDLLDIEADDEYCSYVWGFINNVVANYGRE